MGASLAQNRHLSQPRRLGAWRYAAGPVRGAEIQARVRRGGAPPARGSAQGRLEPGVAARLVDRPFVERVVPQAPIGIVVPEGAALFDDVSNHALEFMASRGRSQIDVRHAA